MASNSMSVAHCRKWQSQEVPSGSKRWDDKNNAANHVAIVIKTTKQKTHHENNMQKHR